MDIDIYQTLTRSTAIYPTPRLVPLPADSTILEQMYPPLDVGSLIYPALGLASECGELAGKVKKIMRDKNCTVSKEDRDELAKELGDVLWYVAAVANGLNISLGHVAQANLDKLQARQQAGTLQGSGDNR